jgi:hypothetical protein
LAIYENRRDRNPKRGDKTLAMKERLINAQNKINEVIHQLDKELNIIITDFRFKALEVLRDAEAHILEAISEYERNNDQP